TTGVHCGPLPTAWLEGAITVRHHLRQEFDRPERGRQPAVWLLALLAGAFVGWGGGAPLARPSDDKAPEKPSPLDALDPRQVPAEERFDLQPKGLVAVLGSHRGRHWGEVTAVAFRPDGKQIASSGFDGAVRIWQAETLRQVALLRGHEGAVFTVAFSPDGT